MNNEGGPVRGSLAQVALSTRELICALSVSSPSAAVSEGTLALANLAAAAVEEASL